MAANFHERYEPEKLPLPPDRSTGLVFAAVAAIVAYVWRADATVMPVALGVAAAFALIALVIPIVIRPLNVVWMRLAMLLNKIMSPIIMLVLFLVAIVPAGLLMQLGHDPLRRTRKGAGESYWIVRDKSAAPSSMSNQF